MQSGLNRLVLCLNAAYQPINVVTARRALVLVCKGAAVTEELSPFYIRTASIRLPVPNVIRFTRYRHVPRLNRAVSRKGIMLRDASTCQYCGQKLPSGDLTLDHVTPKSRGGGSTWENLVSCCFACNNKKDNRTPAEAGMRLINGKPRPIMIHSKIRMLQGDNQVWSKYLYN